MMTTIKYNQLDDAICEHLRKGGVHPVHAEQLQRVACLELGIEPANAADKALRLIDRRLQAMSKAKRVAYERAKGGGHGRWIVLEPAVPSRAAPKPAKAEPTQAASTPAATTQAPGPTSPAAGPVMVYAARFKGMPGFGAVTVDEPERAKTVAKEIASWVRSGASVERVTLEAGRTGMGEYIKAKRKQDAEAKAFAEAQGDLFGGPRCPA